MESLIAFLLDNIFIVIVAAGFLMSLLGKGKQQQQRRVGRMPDFGGGPLQGEPTAWGDRQSDSDSNPAPGYEQPPQPVYTSTMSQPASGGPGMMTRSNQAAAVSRGTGGTGRSVITSQAARSQTSSSSVSLKRVDADDLRQAVLWAEILGPPRARKPHGRHIR